MRRTMLIMCMMLWVLMLGVIPVRGLSTILAEDVAPRIGTRTASGETIEGIWFGTMKIPDGPELRMVFEIFPNADGELRATLISLDQGGMGIPVDEFTFADDILHLEIRSAGLVYEGELQEDGGTIVGGISQAGGSLPLVMERVDEVPGFPRPQTPRRPYPYHEEEVAYENKDAGITIAGTLTLPHSEGPHPAVLLISGSGPQDRDEMLCYHRPFLVLADYLTRRGIAVLRVDDRGWGASTGDFSQATSEDFASDVRAGVEYLKSRPDMDPAKIGLVGHSEGGMIAPMVAVHSPDVAFIVLMAGPGINCVDLLVLQVGAVAESEGMSDEGVAVTQSWFRRLYTVVNQEKDDASAEREIRALYAALSEEEKQLLGWSEAELSIVIQQVLTPWYRYFLSFDPAPVLMAVACPVLAINGEKDVQVTPEENLGGIEAAHRAGGNQDFTVMELADLNHLFQTAETGAVSEYINIAETMSPSALEIMAEWIRVHTGLPPFVTAVLEEQTAPLPRTLSLEQNVPNPFNCGTVIRFTLSASAEAKLSLYNATGQKVATLMEGVREMGTYSVRWDGRDDSGNKLASGMYLYHLQAGDREETRTLLLLR